MQEPWGAILQVITPAQGKRGHGRKGHNQTDQLDVGHDGLLPQTPTGPENTGLEVIDQQCSKLNTMHTRNENHALDSRTSWLHCACKKREKKKEKEGAQAA